MGLPARIIEAQHDFIRYFDNDSGFSGVTDATLGDFDTKIEVAKHLSSHLKMASAYLVTKDMVTLLRHAADGLDDEDRWDRSLAPTPCGFVRFESPIPLREVRGKEMLVHWATWGPAVTTETNLFGKEVRVPGIAVTLWNDARLEPDEVTRLMFEVQGQDKAMSLTHGLFPLTMRLGVDGDRLGASLLTAPDREGEELRPYTNTARIIHALWLMLGQTITSVHEEPVRWKKARAAKFKGLPQAVTVIDLRRIKGVSREPGETHVEWRHRWVVRGHWRWQPYGVGRTERRRIWVAPHIRGPEGLPFLISEKVSVLRR